MLEFHQPEQLLLAMTSALPTAHALCARRCVCARECVGGEREKIQITACKVIMSDRFERLDGNMTEERI